MLGLFYTLYMYQLPYLSSNSLHNPQNEGTIIYR